MKYITVEQELASNATKSATRANFNCSYQSKNIERQEYIENCLESQGS